MNKPLLLLLCVLLASCTRSYKICGHSSYSKMDGYVIQLKTLQGGEWVGLDSAEIVHGEFAMNGRLDSLCMAMLFIKDTPILPVVLEKGQIDIDISNNHTAASGTPLNNALYHFFDKQHRLEAKMSELEITYSNNTAEYGGSNNTQQHLDEKMDLLLQEMNTRVHSFILEHADNVLGPNVFMMLCGSLPYPIITPEIQVILDDAPCSFKKNWMVAKFIKEAEENKVALDESVHLSADAELLYQ